MKPYAKQPKSNEELVALLQSRGLTADAAKLLRILETVGYYRFTGYLYPFKTPNSNTFRPNTTLETAWNIYMFDRHLRLTTMDALARIEIAVRAITTRCHTDFIDDPFAYVNPANMPKLSQAKHGGLLARIADSTHKASSDPKIKHLATEYGIMNYPPIWTMMEIVPLGTVTFYFHGLPDCVQKAIADIFHGSTCRLGNACAVAIATPHRFCDERNQLTLALRTSWLRTGRCNDHSRREYCSAKGSH